MGGQRAVRGACAHGREHCCAVRGWNDAPECGCMARLKAVNSTRAIGMLQRNHVQRVVEDGGEEERGTGVEGGPRAESVWGRIACPARRGWLGEGGGRGVGWEWRKGRECGCVARHSSGVPARH